MKEIALAALGGIVPALVLIQDSLSNYEDPLDWRQILRIAIAGVIARVLPLIKNEVNK